jgi:UDP-N-acetylmuramate--alanine ligase
MKGIKKAYFIGIGGIGMSALAQLMQDAGVSVSGSDREASPVTELLQKKGVSVALVQKAENVPNDADIVVYSEAVWEDNPERARARELGLKQMSYFTMLGEVSRTKKTIAVAGTHGKTTTTGMAAKILADAGGSPTAVVGSIVKDFGSNYLKGDSVCLVAEACEYKRDFLTLSPFVLVITNIEWDHTDYYPTLGELQKAFRELAEKVPADGAIVTNPSNTNIAPVIAGLSVKVIDYTKEPAYDLRLPGEFNRMNARAAAAAARFVLASITEDSIATSLSHFHGTWRRFEYKGKAKNGAEVYDDYAHHPTAIKSTLEQLRKKVPAGGKLYVAFHPHLYSRTRDLLPEFATAFKDADEVIIAPIYAAREPDDGVTSNKLLAEKISEAGTHARFGTFDEIERILSTESTANDIIMTMGAGDIYKVADNLVA